MNQHYDDRGRRILSHTEYFLYAFLPILVLLGVAMTPVKVINTKLKQVISLPMLTLLITVPYVYKSPIGGIVSVFYPVVPFALFLRFMDIYWITPLLYKKESYLGPAEASQEFWASLRVKQKKTNAKKIDEPQVKDGKFYHLFTPILLNLIVYDVLVSWAKTFTQQEISDFKKGFTLHSVIYFFLVVLILTAILNLTGKVLQLIYCVFVDGGSFVSAEWRNLMEHPICGRTLEEVWAKRWHGNMRTAWMAFAFRPIYFMTEKYNKSLALLLASLSVFFVSGLTHEYSILCESGWDHYKQHYFGDQTIFFVTNGVLVIFQKSLGAELAKRLPKAIKDSIITEILLRVFSLGVSAYLFPYFIDGFCHLGYSKLVTLTPFIEPAVRQFASSVPALRPLCGSLL